MKSIISGNKKEQCFLCGKYGQTESHHIFGGAFRKKSEQYGLKVNLCHYCHNEPSNGAHYNLFVSQYLKQIAQKEAMSRYKWTVNDFRTKFGKSWLEEENDSMRTNN